MGRTFLIAVLGYLFILAGIGTLHASYLLLVLPLFLYLLLGLWQGPEKVQLGIERHLSAERVLMGNEVSVSLSVTNRGARLQEVVLEDMLPEGLEVVEGSSHRLLTLDAGQTFSWKYTLRGKRGYFILGSVRVTVRDVLGLVKIQEEVPAVGQLFILPHVMRLRRVAIRPRLTRVYSGTIPARQGGPGVEFSGVREYQIGDSPRWINWHATARSEQVIYSNEFEQERVADVGILLDGRRKTNEFSSRRSLFEHSVLAAAAMADAFLTSGNRVGMLFYGKQIIWTLPGYGRLQREKILHDLSRAEIGEVHAGSRLIVPHRLFPSRSQLVFISPLLLDDLGQLIELRSKGYQVLIISPDPVAFEMDILPKKDAVVLAGRIMHMQRKIFLNQLRHSGIQVVDWDVKKPFEQVARRELERSPAWLRTLSRGERL